MKILLTGAAGFIGSALALRLLERGNEVIGIDNHNDYYDPAIKEARLARYSDHTNYTHLRIDLGDRVAIEECFAAHKPQRVVNLAAQAGVRYSIENPLARTTERSVGAGCWLRCRPICRGGFASGRKGSGAGLFQRSGRLL
jgi:UDP-glucuronate 4-epimerase